MLKREAKSLIPCLGPMLLHVFLTILIFPCSHTLLFYVCICRHRDGHYNATLATAGLNAMKAYFNKCPDLNVGGAINSYEAITGKYIAGALFANGSVVGYNPATKTAFDDKPSHFAAFIRAFLHLRSVFLLGSDDASAQSCLDMAMAVAVGWKVRFGASGFIYTGSVHLPLAELVFALEKGTNQTLM